MSENKKSQIPSTEGKVSVHSEREAQKDVTKGTQDTTKDEKKKDEKLSKEQIDELTAGGALKFGLGP
ncbi:hypothetical protein HDU85_005832 [Gaertneriomyces sp. JEL0708]|nr:hypothetical protein HDU85_005832 [Gaertneriomyces sp. JEL0708]